MREPRAAALALATLSATVVLAACNGSGGGELTSCQDSLTGTWIRERSSGGSDRAAAEERWAIIDRRARVEIYPLFDDTAARAAADARAQLVRSPRSLELLRSRVSLLGHVERWVMRRGTKCVVRGNARISGCKSDARGAYLEAQMAALPGPTSDEEVAACLPGPRTLPSQAERWRRAE